VQPAITYIYAVWANLCVMSVFLFKPPFCNGPETEMKCKCGFWPWIIFAFYHLQTVGA